MDVKKLNEAIANELKLYEMAQKQGSDKQFIYYTLDNERASHRPHVHICVFKNNKHWNGSDFNNGQNLKSVASVFLPFEQLKDGILFSPENLQFETITDDKIKSKKYVNTICTWLNSKVKDSFGNEILNAIKCFNDYKMSNGDTCTYLKNLKEE